MDSFSSVDLQNNFNHRLSLQHAQPLTNPPRVTSMHDYRGAIILYNTEYIALLGPLHRYDDLLKRTFIFGVFLFLHGA